MRVEGGEEVAWSQNIKFQEVGRLKTGVWCVRVVRSLIRPFLDGEMRQKKFYLAVENKRSSKSVRKTFVLQKQF